MNYKLINLKYRMGKMTAAEVWEHVPDQITEEEACRICGPRPKDE